LRIAVGILPWPGVVFPASRIALQISVPVIKGKSILQVAAVGESKSILPTSAEFVKRLYIRISCFLLISAARPVFGFSRFVNRGLQ
jgi:hypothetical protein